MKRNLCPLLLAGYLTSNNDLNPVCNCQGEDCAWYSKDETMCGILAKLHRISVSLVDKGQYHE